MNKMETSDNKGKNTHHGHAIKRIRQSMLIKQEALAAGLNITQSMVSTLESRREIEDDMIEKVAKILKVSPQLIKDLEEDSVSVIIDNNRFENNEKVSNIGNYSVEDNSINNFNAVDKIVELFETLLQKEQEKIALLEKLLNKKQ